ncbi:citrate synthase [Microbacterium azadirachtae]|uniref:citrate synthase n=1 Tax=Microbacterium azadirachtae TaxID=582680 RepID=UPI00088A22FE|nr:citrate synthase [Microbacterium azadirachtae]SDL28927.1 citrate synthase [Microbacterium azadirachtae]SEF58948.1 citrate synthase [Microbacterium azadirachtae]SEF59633.1 citrate synthase [Microbacterium azadirachtae]
MAITIDRNDTQLIDVPRGLTNVVVAETRIGDVRGAEGFFHYRGVSGVELAADARFEDAWHLVALGALPADDSDAGRWRTRTAAARRIPAPVSETLPSIARSGLDAMAQLRTALALVSAADGRRALYDEDESERVDDAVRLAAVAPALIAALHRLGRGLDPLAPDPVLDPISDYLRMLLGSTPDARLVTALGTYLTAAIDHGFNASTFTARVIASTGADLASCVGGALGALAGPLHGGAPARTLDMLDEIGSPDRAEAWVRDRVHRGGRIMGFGHAVYRTEDPRSRLLRGVAQRLRSDGLASDRVDLAVTVEQTVLRVLDELKPGRSLRTNVELYAAVVMEACGIPRELFTPTFASARLIGWGAHACEQVQDGKILRPSSRYVGPAAG